MHRRRRERLARTLRQALVRFRQSELGGLAGDSGYVAVVQGSVVLAGLLQLALITHALGLAGYGTFSLVVAFPTLVAAFFNLRVDIGATTYSARYMRSDPRRAIGVFQMSYGIDLLSAVAFIVTFGVLVNIVGSGIVGGVAPGVVFIYAMALVGRNLEAVPLVILRQLDRFRLVAVATLITEMARVGMVFVALTIWGSLLAVVIAIAIGQVSAGVIKAWLAVRMIAREYPRERVTESALPEIPPEDRTALRKTIFQTNLLSFEGIAQVQVPTLLLGAIAGATETGLYKVGMAIAALIGAVAAPVSGALLPRVSRLWAEGRFLDLRDLLKQATMITLPVIITAYLFIVVFRDQILTLIGGGPEATAAGTVLLLGAGGQAVYAAVFWRTNMLHAAHRTGAVAAASVMGAVLQTAAVLLLVPPLGADGAALAYLLSRFVINGTLTFVAIRTLASAINGRSPPPLPAP